MLHLKYGQSFVNQVRNDYMKALQLRETERIDFKEDPHTNENEDYVWFSSLGYCPLKSALSRRKATPKFPELLIENDPWLMVRLDAAVRLARSVQEAFLWKFRDRVQVEKRAVNHELKATGRTDLTFYSEDGLQVYEIKHRADPKPHLQDCYQAIGYMMTLNAVMSHIIIIGDNGWPVNVWSLVEKNNGFILMNDQREVYPEPWNTPERINYAETKRLIDVEHEYLRGAMELPISEPLNDERGWLCIRSIPGKYPSKKLGTPGLKRVACPYGCHSDTIDPRPYFLLPDGTYSYDDPKHKPF